MKVGEWISKLPQVRKYMFIANIFDKDNRLIDSTVMSEEGILKKYINYIVGLSNVYSIYACDGNYDITVKVDIYES